MTTLEKLTLHAHKTMNKQVSFKIVECIEIISSLSNMKRIELVMDELSLKSGDIALFIRRTTD